MIETETAAGHMVVDALKVSVPRGALTEQVGIVARGLSARSTVLVLGGIRLTATPGTLELAATDMDISLRAELDATVDAAGSVVVPGRLFLDIARTLPDGEVSIEHLPDEAILSITSGSAAYRIQTYSSEDYPTLPTVDESACTPVASDVLLETVARVGRSASRDESRPVLTGVLVKFEPGKLVMAATDSYRLAVKETETSGDYPDLEAIIPARALQELARIATPGGHVHLGVQENHVIFGAEGVWLTTRRIDGQFPNYRQLLPEQFEHELTLPRDAVLDVVRRVGVLAQRNSPLRLRFAEGELTVSAQTQDVGEARESLPVPFSGEPLEIGFNAEFLRDGLDSIPSGSVTIKLISPLRPAVLKGETPDYTYLIMPIRLAG